MHWRNDLVHRGSLQPLSRFQGSVPPYIWLAVPSTQTKEYREHFGSDQVEQEAEIQGFDLSKIPLYQLLQ